MRKYLFLILIVFSLINCKQSTLDNSNVKKTDVIEFGQVDSLYSSILEESRKIWVYLPESFLRLSGNKKYPVLYLLDGDGHYFSVSGMIRQLSAITILPEMIIVAIPNTNRNRDLTPTHVDIDFFTGDSIAYESGGGDKFLDFIENELVTHIEKKYPANSYRTYVGHSFGGLSVINALIKKPNLFNNYIAIDPSLWWDNLAFKNYADSIIKTDDFKGKALYVAIANTMNEGMDIENVANDTTKNTAHIRSILSFVESLERVKSNNLDFRWKYYNDDNHGSVPMIAEYDGLRYLFRWHNFKGLNKIINSASEMSAEELIYLPIEHFKEVSKHFGFEVLPDQELINAIGYYLLTEKMPVKASVFFDLNIKNYPNSSNVYDSRGDCYLATSDSLKALEFFNKALNIEDLEIYRNKIEELEKNIKR